MEDIKHYMPENGKCNHVAAVSILSCPSFFEKKKGKKKKSLCPSVKSKISILGKSLIHYSPPILTKLKLQVTPGGQIEHIMQAKD